VNKAAEHSRCEIDSRCSLAGSFSHFRFDVTDDVRRLRIVKNGSMEIVAHEQSIPSQNGARHVIFFAQMCCDGWPGRPDLDLLSHSNARYNFTASLALSIRCSCSFTNLFPPTSSINSASSIYFGILSGKKGGNPIGSSPPEGFRGMRAFGRRLPIGDSSNVIVEPEGTGYSQKYQNVTALRQWNNLHPHF
jgi:hypothetical protein